MATRYEDCRPDTERETRSLKAVDEPRTMRERRREMNVLTRMERMGRAVRVSTWIRRSTNQLHYLTTR